MEVKAFFDKDTYTLTYVVWDKQTKDAVIIDPVMNYDAASSTYSYESIDEVAGFANDNSLTVHLILETHAHADHLSGSQELKKRFPKSLLAIGADITKVQETFKSLFNLKEIDTDGSQFDFLFNEGEKVEAGSIEIQPIHTPGHTPACYSFLIGDSLFTGDALFMPDYGVGRCDFPLGSAKQLYNSVKGKLYELPATTNVYTGHDYQPNGRALRFESTIKEQKENNIHINANTTESEFVEFRTNRDKTLSAPKLLLPSVQININAGHFYKPEDNGVSYIKLPLRGKK